jgi:MFS family permease
MDPYRRVLARPGVRALLAVSLLARLPVTAAGLTLTMHVVQDMGRGYGAAGLVGAVYTIGLALGAPLLGRLVDRRGLRAMLVLTTVVEAAFWVVAPVLSFPLLLLAALPGGLLTIPVFSVTRQSIAALVGESDWRPAYALDSMSVELCYMAGPMLAVLLIRVSVAWAMLAVGASVVLSGALLSALNPPIRGEDEATPGADQTVRRRDWLRPRFVALLLVVVAAAMALSGTEVSIVATLRAADQFGWAGLVLTAWSTYSLLGAFVYGTLHRHVSPAVLVGLLALATVPLAAVTNWWTLCLLLLPAGALCAPSVAASADGVSRMTPAAARGEAMGLHGSALTAGTAIGTPLAGAVIDATSPGWGYAVVGLVGAVTAALMLPAQRQRATPAPLPAVPAAAVAQPVAAPSEAAVAREVTSGRRR